MEEAQQQRVFDEWLGAHRGLCTKVLRAFAFSQHDREDLFQEIAFQLWDSIPRFKHDSSVTTWIYRVALYSAIAWSRKERRHTDGKQTFESSVHATACEPARADRDEDPRIEWLYSQIARLDPVDRSLVLLLLEGLSYREMAGTLGISESNVGVKINRIKKTLAGRSKVRTGDGL